MKKNILILLLALSLVLTLASCTSCEHVDADDDYLCDKCGEHFDDGDEYVEPENKDVDLTITVTLDDGTPLSGVKINLASKSASKDVVSGADGKVKVTLEPGNYAITYDYDTIPEYCTPDTFGVKIEEGMTTLSLVIVDNQPDGSAEKPFYISESTTEITVEPGQEIFFNYRGTTAKYVRVYHADAVVYYDGEVGTAVDGVTNLLLQPADVGRISTFSVKNTSDTAFTTTMELIAPLGTIENPIVLGENSATVTVEPEQMLYYSWTADKDGMLVLATPTERNSITLTKTLENDVLVIAVTDGSAAAYLPVSAGDVITLGISSIAPTSAQLQQDPTLGTKPLDIEFTLNVYAGTEADPVPVLKNDFDVSIGAGSSIVFAATAGQTLRVDDDSIISVTNGDSTVTNENGNAIVVELTSNIFTITNMTDHINGITVSLKNSDN